MRRVVASVTALGLLLSAPVGNASLEDDCYYLGGYFVATYYEADYFDESCSTGEPPSPVSDDNKFRNIFRFPGIWR